MSSRRSERHPKHVFWMRLVVFILVLSSLKLDKGHVQKNTPRKVGNWAENFIQLNQLNTQVETIQLAKNEVTEINKSKPNHRTVIQKEIIVEQSAANPIESAPVVNETPHLVGLYIRSTEKEAFIHTDDIEEDIPLYLHDKRILIDQGSSDYYGEEEQQINLEPNENTHELFAKWYVSGIIGPQYFDGDVTQPSSDVYEKVSGINNIVSKAGGVSSSTNGQSFGASFQIGYRLTKKWDVLSGIKYSQLNGTQLAYYDSEVTKNQTIVTSTATNNSDGTKSYSSRVETIEYTNYFSDTLTTNYRLGMMEIPLLVKYNIELKKWNVFVNTGFSGVVRTKYSASFTSNEIPSGTLTESKNKLLAMNFVLGAGIEHKISKVFRAQISPTYSKGMVIKNQQAFQSDLHNWGIYCGISYYIK